MPTIFYEDSGIVVSDTTFILPNGDQYPVRNISSVKVRDKDIVGLLVAGILFASYAIMVGNPYTLVVSLIFFTLWWLTRANVLLIGSGGITQEALTFNKREQEKLQLLISIAAAINESISNLQKT